MESVTQDFEALKLENKRIVEQSSGKNKVKVTEKYNAATMTLQPQNEDREAQCTEQVQENEC